MCVVIDLNVIKIKPCLKNQAKFEAETKMENHSTA